MNCDLYCIVSILCESLPQAISITSPKRVFAFHLHFTYRNPSALRSRHNFPGVEREDTLNIQLRTLLLLFCPQIRGRHDEPRLLDRYLRP